MMSAEDYLSQAAAWLEDVDPDNSPAVNPLVTMAMTQRTVLVTQVTP